MRPRNVVLALILAGCAGGPSAAERAAEEARIRDRIRDVESASDWTTAPKGGDHSAADVFEWTVAAEDQAAELAEKLTPADAAPDVVAAAAMGLGFCKSDGAERVLIGLALRPSHPPQAPEALFAYYKTRGADKPPPSTIPPQIIEVYASHPDARGRAALAHLGRAIKDAALVPHLERLARDDDWEVRRAVALALAEGPAKVPRPRDLAKRCIATLRSLANDADQRVVASACRAVASYDDETAVGMLFFALHHADFNVRVAAIEGLGKRKASGAVSELERIAKTDASTSCRYAAATQLAEINPVAARGLVDHLLRFDAGFGGIIWGEPEYVRTAAVEILGKAEDGDASIRLAAVFKDDPHVRVRESAVGGFKGKTDDVAKQTLRAALADADVGVVSTACGVVHWLENLDTLLEIPGRFPGCAGADAREAALSALSVSWNTSDPRRERRQRLFEAYVHDPNPAVRAAAEKMVSVPPVTPTRGADLSGELLPGGAPIFEKDAFLIVETDQGTMKIRLFPEQAPVHCAHVAAFAKSGGYDGLTWHRVVPDFVIQGGCPRGDGSGNAGVTLPLEPTMIPFERGTLGMPRSDHPDTGGCQLFICHSRAPHLDVRYTAFGRVVEGMDVIDRIDVDSKIVRVRVEGVR